MVETRRSDEPLVETVDPDALARRGRASGSGAAVPERGRKAAAREHSPAPSQPRNPSYFEEVLAVNEWAFYALMMARVASQLLPLHSPAILTLTRTRAQEIGAMAMMTAVFTPVPASDFVFVLSVWVWAAMATALRFPRKARVEQPGPYPFRPIAAPPIRGFADQHQARRRCILHAPLSCKKRLSAFGLSFKPARLTL